MLSRIFFSIWRKFSFPLRSKKVRCKKKKFDWMREVSCQLLIRSKCSQILGIERERERREVIRLKKVRKKLTEKRMGGKWGWWKEKWRRVRRKPWFSCWNPFSLFDSLFPSSVSIFRPFWPFQVLVSSSRKKGWKLLENLFLVGFLSPRIFGANPAIMIDTSRRLQVRRLDERRELERKGEVEPLLVML